MSGPPIFAEVDVVELDRRAVLVTAAMLDATHEDRYEAPTPCPDWCVRDLVAHLVAGNVKYTEIGRGADWSRGAPVVVVGDDPGFVYRRTAEEMFEAWQRPGALDREITLPQGRGRAESALYLHLGETLIHGWDLAMATGQAPSFDVEVVEASLAQYRSWLPPGRPAGAPFADAAGVDDGAPAIHRLAAYLGRDVAAWS
ncbi:MAG: TIGR03086 family metal-binding protein [Actinomycetota bacterium]|nr:TIGR03086 family metal-binding protein [Actinomycetota bacterium]